MGAWLLIFLFLGVLALGVVLHLQRHDPAARAQETMRALDDAVTRAQDLAAATRALTRELEKVGGDVAEQAADRLRALQSAVAEADTRLEALKRGGERPAPPPPSPVASGPRPAQHNDRPSRLDVTVDDEGARPGAGASGVSERHRRIYALADSGHTLEEIAQQMRMGKGEVQLVLSLRGSKK